ncbi:hypothetical protein KCV87_07050 [Actinosynnema pretiosum subsp. pretiosum]|uniref:Uncharacterized protein n=1 Tax=Actinosynnema pretiosum subsp. pretiosum TaxID=103721 RepID=A0AA45L9J9_9PSEU|nr:hypothetical protein APASM_2623 [Actinosynnema pretiosum subsp. pretiosum]QUF05831.1 hypothetical protein KCV87_07050 [Actinosynnema pretiosum subsp. pretiosum]
MEFPRLARASREEWLHLPDSAVGWGKFFTGLLLVLQALVWAAATLAVAAYTGLIRKPA